MELKDVILSTLAEIEDIANHTGTVLPSDAIAAPEISVSQEEIAHELSSSPSNPEDFSNAVDEIRSGRGSDDEIRMLEGMRERMLVLFEGFQSPNNVNIEAKVDLTLNFLEYLLATIENRLDAIR